MKAMDLPTPFRIPMLAALAAMALFPAAARAAGDAPTLVATHGKWSVYTFSEQGKPVCYMLSQPVKDEGDYTQRGDIYALVTDRPADGSKDVFSYIAGYPYKPGSNVTISVDDHSFTLFTQDDTAWAPDAATDAKIAKAMLRGRKMVVKGVSTKGTNTRDTFSLDGSGAAYKAKGNACGAGKR